MSAKMKNRWKVAGTAADGDFLTVDSTQPAGVKWAGGSATGKRPRLDPGSARLVAKPVDPPSPPPPPPPHGHSWQAVGLVDMANGGRGPIIIKAVAQSCRCGAVRAVPLG